MGGVLAIVLLLLQYGYGGLVKTAVMNPFATPTPRPVSPATDGYGIAFNKCLITPDPGFITCSKEAKDIRDGRLRDPAYDYNQTLASYQRDLRDCEQERFERCSIRFIPPSGR